MSISSMCGFVFNLTSCTNNNKDSLNVLCRSMLVATRKEQIQEVSEIISPKMEAVQKLLGVC